MGLGDECILNPIVDRILRSILEIEMTDEEREQQAVPEVHAATFRFYAELNDFLPIERRQRTFVTTYRGAPAVKDTIEAQGVPHTEVELILVNGRSVDFTYQLRDDDHVAVYPVFESLDITPVLKVRTQPLRTPRFILDVHLGKLARLLRLLGFDTLYRNDYEDAEIVAIAAREHRIILTRDVGLLKHKAVTHGYWVRSTLPQAQAREVLARFDLNAQIRPFQRCLICNTLLEPIEKSEVLDRIPPRVAAAHDRFFICPVCDKIFWRGSHYTRLQAKVEQLIDPCEARGLTGKAGGEIVNDGNREDTSGERSR